MMFWLGLIIGSCIGAIVGIFLLALCQVAGDADRRMGLK